MSYESFVNKLHHIVGKRYICIAGKYVTMKMSKDVQYSKEERLAVLSFAGVGKTYITTAARRLRMINNGKGKKIPSEETVLDSIRFVRPDTLFEEMKDANNHIIQMAVENNEFDYDIFVAIDTHNVSRHTKIGIDNSRRKRECTDIKTIVGTKPKDGTRYAHQYMTIQNLKIDKDRPSYVLAFDRVLPLSDKTKIAESLIDECESKIEREISLIVGDGHFDDVNMMKMFKRKGKHFVVRADQDPKVKGIIQKKAKGLSCYVEFNYVKGSRDNIVTVNLIVLSVKWLRRKGVKYPLIKDRDRYLTFFTDLSPIKGETIADFCLRVAKYYKKRWGIETGYRDISDFEGKTHSLRDSVRLFLYIQAILLYNIWVQVNLMYRDDPDRKKYFRDGITKDMIRFIIEQTIIKEVIDGKYEGPLKR